MQQTLLQVRNLEKFIQKHGDDAVLSQTISKIVDYKICKYAAEIKRLDKDLKKFERTYKKESARFLKEFKEGKLGDDMDFIEWSSLCQMRNNLTDKKLELEGSR
ncbi:MAG: hypothetical protein HY807_01260 [Nitrospirae bacterium]|nr:hypothetical protein [Nitrospirota bacterium]